MPSMHRTMPKGMRAVMVRDDGFGISHIVGQPRQELNDLLEQHYLGIGGQSGYSFGVHDPDFRIIGGALVGRTASEACNRSLIAASHDVRAVKRSFILDAIPQPELSDVHQAIPIVESQLIRTAINEVADALQQTLLFVSYSDPLAVDIRHDPPQPLLGWSNFAAGFFFAGWTRSKRYVAIDADGRARSPRQGGITLTPSNINRFRPGWKLVKAPPLRIWLTVVPPHYHIQGDKRRRATHAWRTREWHRAWAALHPERKIAAKNWVRSDEWQALLRAGQQPINEQQRNDTIRPIKSRHQGNTTTQFQPAWWSGWQMQRDAAPVWVPEYIQTTLELIDEATSVDEVTAYRAYLPRLHAATTV